MWDKCGCRLATLSALCCLIAMWMGDLKLLAGHPIRWVVVPFASAVVGKLVGMSVYRLLAGHRATRMGIG